MPRAWPAWFEDLVHGGRGFGECWADLVAVDRFGDGGAAVVHQVADVLDPDAAVVAEDGHEAAAQLSGIQSCPSPAAPAASRAIYLAQDPGIFHDTPAGDVDQAAAGRGDAGHGAGYDLDGLRVRYED